MSKITASRVSIEFETISGYESKEDFMDLGESKALKSALSEIIRLLILNGEEREVLKIIKEVGERK